MIILGKRFKMAKFIKVFLLIFFIFILSGIAIFMYKGVPITSYTVEKVLENDTL